MSTCQYRRVVQPVVRRCPGLQLFVQVELLRFGYSPVQVHRSRHTARHQRFDHRFHRRQAGAASDQQQGLIILRQTRTTERQLHRDDAAPAKMFDHIQRRLVTGHGADMQFQFG